MIIVSQDKSRIVNFERVEILGIDLENNKQIVCGFNQGKLALGKYETEERAREVLKDMVHCYSLHEVFKTQDKANVFIVLKEWTMKDKLMSVYKMPED